MWQNMQRHDQPQSIKKVTPLIQSPTTLPESSISSPLPPLKLFEGLQVNDSVDPVWDKPHVDSVPAPAPLPEPKKAVGAVAEEYGLSWLKDIDNEDFDIGNAINEFAKLKERATQLPDDQRRAMAANVAMAFAQMLGEESDSD